MGAVCNGLSLSKLRPFGSGFLIFTDYMKPAIRLGAIMEIAGHLRLHPRFDRRRRGRTDASAGRAAGRRCARSRALSCCARPTPTRWPRPGASSCRCKHQPACLILSRQNLPTLDRSRYASAAGVARGAYVLADAVAGASPR